VDIIKGGVNNWSIVYFNKSNTKILEKQGGSLFKLKMAEEKMNELIDDKFIDLDYYKTFESKPKVTIHRLG